MEDDRDDGDIEPAGQFDDLLIPDLQLEPLVAAAEFEHLHDSDQWYATVSGLQGVWATGTTRHEARQQLVPALLSWLSFHDWRGLSIPREAEQIVAHAHAR